MHVKANGICIFIELVKQWKGWDAQLELHMTYLKLFFNYFSPISTKDNHAQQLFNIFIGQ